MTSIYDRLRDHPLWNDRFVILRDFATGPVTALVLILYAFGMAKYYRNVRDYKGKGKWWRILYGAPFLIIDTLYNWTIGTWVWAELPRETLYTARLERKAKEEDRPWAFTLCEILSIWDPDHCRLCEEDCND